LGFGRIGRSAASDTVIDGSRDRPELSRKSMAMFVPIHGPYQGGWIWQPVAAHAPSFIPSASSNSWN
jgi:hypothetical protein